MKVTAWALIVIGVVIALFTVAYNLIDFNRTVEQVGTASGSTDGGYWFALIPAAILIVCGVAIRNQDATAGEALIAIAVGVIFLVSALSLATRQVFEVALYRYANGSPDSGGFATADLADPFRRRGGD